MLLMGWGVQVARDALDARLMQLVSHEELSHWVEQIHQHFRQQLVALPEWNLLERLEAQAKQWATRVFVEETVDRRVNSEGQRWNTTISPPLLMLPCS